MKSFLNFLNKSFMPQKPSREIRLGIWGTKGSGKTIYLSMLYDALEVSEDWRVIADAEAREFLEKHRQEMDNMKKPGILPLPTEKNDEIEIFSYTLIPESSNVGNSKIVLKFIDAPGEFYEQINNLSARVIRKASQSYSSDAEVVEEDTEVVEEYKDIVDYLMSCDGIIFLFDPKPNNNIEYRSLVTKLFFEFQKRSSSFHESRLQQYMAFCITKIDDDDELWKKGQNPQELAKELMGSKILDFIRNYAWLETNAEKRRKEPYNNNRCEFFAVSAIGRYEDLNGHWCKALEEANQNSHNSSNTQQLDLIVPNTPQESEGFGLNINKPSRQKPSSFKVVIKEGVDRKPLNVIEPIQWLLEGILSDNSSRTNWN